jgi:hypothetical protein
MTMPTLGANSVPMYWVRDVRERATALLDPGPKEQVTKPVFVDDPISEIKHGLRYYSGMYMSTLFT